MAREYPRSREVNRDALHRFAAELREVWVAAGQPAYRQISRDLETRGRFYSKSTIGDVLRGTRLPKPAMLCDLVGYLHGDVNELSDRLKLLMSPVSAGGKAEPPGPNGFAVAGPRQLPNYVVDFTGRLAQLAQLDHIFAGGVHGHAEQAPSGPTVAAIIGSGGIGKTTLALHWAQRNVGRFPDGQLYVDLQGFGPEPPMRPAAAMRRFLTALGVDPRTIPPDPDAQAALYRSMLADKHILLVLDNASDSDQVLPLLSGGQGSVVLITSRMRLGTLAVRGARPVAVGVFGDDEARQFLANRLGRAQLAGEPDAVDALLAQCAGLPLALSIVAARAAIQSHLPLSAFAEELHDVTTRLDALNVSELDGDLRRVFSWSYQVLTNEAAHAFRVLSLAPGADISLPAAAALLDLSPCAARPLLRILVAAHLVQEHASDRYSMHDLVRLFAAERLHDTETTEERCRAMHRMCHWYLRMADGADRVLAPYRTHVLPDNPSTDYHADFGGHEQAMRWYETEHANLVAITRLAACSHPDFAWQLSNAVFGYYRTSQYWREWLEMQRVGLVAARRAGSAKGEAWVLNGLGIALTNLGQYAEAIASYEQSLAIRRRIGDQLGEAQVLNNLGEMCRQTGRYQQAIDYARADYAICLQINDRYGQMVSLNNLGKVLLNTQQPADALEDQLKALTICREINDPHSEAEIRNDLGEIYRTLDQPEIASHQYHIVEDIARTLGDLLTAAHALTGLSEIAAQLEQPSTAKHYARQAAAIINHVTGATTEALDIRIQALLGRYRPRPGSP
jgi:tetratricopeptide (TPR) repeat protein